MRKSRRPKSSSQQTAHQPSPWRMVFVTFVACVVFLSIVGGIVALLDRHDEPTGGASNAVQTTAPASGDAQTNGTVSGQQSPAPGSEPLIRSGYWRAADIVQIIISLTLIGCCAFLWYESRQKDQVIEACNGRITRIYARLDELSNQLAAQARDRRENPAPPPSQQLDAVQSNSSRKQRVPLKEAITSTGRRPESSRPLTVDPLTTFQPSLENLAEFKRVIETDATGKPRTDISGSLKLKAQDLLELAEAIAAGRGNALPAVRLVALVLRPFGQFHSGQTEADQHLVRVCCELQQALIVRLESSGWQLIQVESESAFHPELHHKSGFVITDDPLREGRVACCIQPGLSKGDLVLVTPKVKLYELDASAIPVY